LTQTTKGDKALLDAFERNPFCHNVLRKSLVLAFFSSERLSFSKEATYDPAKFEYFLTTSDCSLPMQMVGSVVGDILENR
jgi:hypothetical protein